MSEQLKQAHEAFASTEHSDATTSYVDLLEKELAAETKRYEEVKQWWLRSSDECDTLKQDVAHLQADVDYYRSIIGHEFNKSVYGSKE